MPSSLCLACERSFPSIAELQRHKCGETAAFYTVPTVGRRQASDPSVMPHRICPACARPYGDRKSSIADKFTIAAHNIISRDALKTSPTMKRKCTEVLTGTSSLDLPGLGTYANLLMVYFVLHFDGLISKATLPKYRLWTDGNNNVLSDWAFIRSFLDAHPKYLFHPSPGRPFGTGDGDRDDEQFSYKGVLDILFGTLAGSVPRDRTVEPLDWDYGANAATKIRTILAAIDGVAPSDSYVTNYCQTDMRGPQCNVCEKRQGEANLLTRFHAAKAQVGKSYSKGDGTRPKWALDSEGLLSFVGVQFCCNERGSRETSLDKISEEWLMKAVHWQLGRHLEKVKETLESKRAHRDNPVLELLSKNFGAFSEFYFLCYLRLSAGDYADADGKYELGSVSDGVLHWLGKEDSTGAGTTVAVSLRQRRFDLVEGALVGGTACLLTPG